MPLVSMSVSSREKTLRRLSRVTTCLTVPELQRVEYGCCTVDRYDDFQSRTLTFSTYLIGVGC